MATDLGQFLRTMRQYNNERLYDMAKKLNCESWFLSAVEQGKEQMSIEMYNNFLDMYVKDEDTFSKYILEYNKIKIKEIIENWGKSNILFFRESALKKELANNTVIFESDEDIDEDIIKKAINEGIIKETLKELEHDGIIVHFWDVVCPECFRTYITTENIEPMLGEDVNCDLGHEFEIDKDNSFSIFKIVKN